MSSVDNIQDLIGLLRAENASLVVSNHGVLRAFYKKGVRDLEYLLDNEPDFLRGATVADKVVGKASAGMMAYGGVVRLYAATLSRLAVPMLEAGGIEYSYGLMVDQIIIPEGDDRCPLEQIVAAAETPGEVVRLLREHFLEVSSSASGRSCR